jgi:hypothetical protein
LAAAVLVGPGQYPGDGELLAGCGVRPKRGEQPGVDAFLGEAHRSAREQHQTGHGRDDKHHHQASGAHVTSSVPVHRGGPDGSRAT